MNRPRGYYVDQMSTWARGLTPLQEDPSWALASYWDED